MFSVRITNDAKSFIVERFAREGLIRPGLMIHRQGPIGDLERTSYGQAKWNIERRHPWKAQIFEIGDDNDALVFVDGLSVWLALIPRDGELGVLVGVRDGELVVEAAA